MSQPVSNYRSERIIECSICLEQILEVEYKDSRYQVIDSKSDIVCSRVCHPHFFHKACVRPWLEEGKHNCPTCNNDLFSKNVVHYQGFNYVYEQYLNAEVNDNNILKPPPNAQLMQINLFKIILKHPHLYNGIPNTIMRWYLLSIPFIFMYSRFELKYSPKNIHLLQNFEKLFHKMDFVKRIFSVNTDGVVIQQVGLPLKAILGSLSVIISIIFTKIISNTIDIIDIEKEWHFYNNHRMKYTLCQELFKIFFSYQMSKFLSFNSMKRRDIFLLSNLILITGDDVQLLKVILITNSLSSYLFLCRNIPDDFNHRDIFLNNNNSYVG